MSVSVQNLTGPLGVRVDTAIRVPHFQGTWITAPIVVYRARPRTDRDAPPAVILSPRATVELDGEAAQILVESSYPADLPLVLEVRDKGQVIRTDTLAFRPADRALRSATTLLEPHELPPGAVTLRLGLEGEALDSAALLVALRGDWLTADYQEAMNYLRYAGAPQTLDSLRQARPGERARLLHRFWKRKDPVPETTENEFFERYFRRIADANDRFREPGGAGWLTDRAAVYVILGSPDEVLRHVDAWQGPERSQIWLYRNWLESELRLVFVDRNGTGEFRLTDESRRAFDEVVKAL